MTREIKYEFRDGKMVEIVTEHEKIKDKWRYPGKCTKKYSREVISSMIAWNRDGMNPRKIADALLTNFGIKVSRSTVRIMLQTPEKYTIGHKRSKESYRRRIGDVYLRKDETQQLC